MYPKKITEDIHLYENFISDDECKSLIKLFEIMIEKDPEYWKSISFYESYSGMYPEPNDPLLKQVGLSPTWFVDTMNRFKDAAALVANQDSEKMSKISFHMQRWLPGAFAPKHSDNTSNDGVYGAFTRSRYAGFLYLNDDFDGGLLKFYAENGKNIFDVTPKSGSFLIFHGGHKNMHEVTTVLNKPRYTIGSFWDDREESDYPQETRDAWAKELAEVRAMQAEQSVEWKDIRGKGLRLTPYGNPVPAKEVGAENE
jgi:hypothetical protein